MEFASNAKGNAALTTGIIGTAGVGLGMLNALSNGNGLLGGLFGSGNYGYRYAQNPIVVNECSEDHCVNRYELGMTQEISALKSDIALRDANTYSDQKLLEVYKYFDGKLNEIGTELCGQRVHNQKTEDSFLLARQDIAAVKAELSGRIEEERKERCCADNAIVNYANATFYPKMVADVTTGTETTAQTLYNPLPRCGGYGCGNNG